MYSLTTPSFRITMVGHESSGKTTFSAAVCKRLIEDSVQGIQLLPSRITDEGITEEPETLYDEQTTIYEYKTNLRLLENKSWPDGTGETTDWNLDLLFHGKKIANISWIDYKGGLIQNPNLDATASEFYATMYNSTALIFFVDAYELTKYIDVGQGDASSGANRIRELILSFTRKPEHATRSTSSADSKRLIFLIALSKVDVTPKKYRGNFSNLINRAKGVFASLTPIMKRQPLWQGAILPFSSVGENNVVIEKESSDGKPKLIAHINPLNVEHAMFYCISKCLKVFAEDEELAKKVRQHGAILKHKPAFASESDYESARSILEVTDIMSNYISREVKELP